MDTTTPLDLAATCAELVGATGSSAVKLNQLLRVYRDMPAELRELQRQIATSKQTLDRLLPLLDRDEPAFQHANDIEALDLHFNAIAFLVRDVQDHVAALEEARSSPFPNWTSFQHIWTNEDIGESGARLDRQLGGLEVYLKVTRPESEAQRLIEITNMEDKACLIAAWDDAAMYMAPPTYASPTIDTARPSNPMVSVDRPISPMNSVVENDGPATPTSRSSQSTPSVAYSSATDQTESSDSQAANYTALSHSVMLPASMSQLTVGAGRRNNYWLDALKNKSSINIPSARKIKSVAMLQKAPIEAAATQGVKVQGDEAYPAEFKKRVSDYARGISPIWEPTTVPSKKKGTKQIYRNRFTREHSDDLSPEKLQSQFKVTERKLWDAIVNREVEKVRRTMEHRWTDNLVVEKRDRTTALHLAASLGLCSIVQILVSLGASANHPDKYGATAMHYAADFGCAGCLRILALANGRSDLDSPKTHVKTALFYAAKRGNLEAVQALLSFGAHVYTHSSTPQETVLYAAVGSGNIEVVEAVLQRGGNPGESFDTLALASLKSREILALLVQAGANIDMRDSAQETLLYKYIKKCDVDMVSFLFSLNAKPAPAANALGIMTAHLALEKGGYPHSAALIKVLLDVGGRVDLQNAIGQTTLHLAVLWGRADVAEVLCQRGANINIKDKKGTTPFQETQELGYQRRVGNTTLADYPGTKAVLERWQQGSVSRVAEVHGYSKAVPEIDGRLASKPRVEADNKLKPTCELGDVKSRFELASSSLSVHELDTRRHSISRKPVLAELPAS
ncbi:hypothetical protein TruAng_004657 [Truncatella angustata]|nr:hypothetical protein TruAng_004657 [Truncatella angustata]